MDELSELPPAEDAPSTRSGYQPGTPKPPFDPPRRRSSLHFSKVFSCSPQHDSGNDDIELQPVSPSPHKADLLNPRTTTPSNTSRRRVPQSNNANVTPGHVAQMQRLFQSAKASLRMDMAFAASPTGSIGSRLPPTKEAEAESPVLGTPVPTSGPSKSWRYSTAPVILLGLDRDVREPVPEASPTLPELQSPGIDLDPTPEPLSSGFNSPIDKHQSTEAHGSGAVYGSSPPPRPSSLPISHEAHVVSSPFEPPDSTLEGQMVDLRVASDDDEQPDVEMDESPIVAHVRKMSAADIPLPASRPMSTEVEDVTLLTDTMIADSAPDEEIFLSEPAKAAAESAKAKRGILRNIFSLGHRGKKADDHRIDAPDSPSPTKTNADRVETPCPDPKLHELFARSTCPDPSAHVTPDNAAIPTVSITPEAMVALAQGSPALPNLSQMPPNNMYGSLQPPTASFQRATSTGSPMPFPRFKSPPPSPPRGAPHSGHLNRPSGRPFSPQPQQHNTLQSDYPDLRGEHFQPGWYYTSERPAPTSKAHPIAYSFSTAAAKSAGQSAAPDSRIRDSYRTDTLTPLAKPPSRYRKTGITAMASARGVSKYYGDMDGRAPGQATRTGTRRPRYRSGVRFRSSPPPQPEDMAPVLHKRRRPKDLEDENFEIREDDSQVMELDDDTRAAIRMSLFGSETPKTLHARDALRELSPNIVTDRKDRRQRKKRRPSYWDGDLKEVQNSPAGRNTETRVDMTKVGGSVREGAERKVMTSPPKESVESLRSQRVEIEGKENIRASNSVPEDLSYTLGDDGMLTSEDEDGTLTAIEREAK